MSLYRRRLCASFLSVCLAGLPALAEDKSKADSSKDASDYIKIAREKTALFRIEDVESGSEFERVEDPVFRYTEPVRGPTEGAMWLWGRKGRPVAVLEMIREADAKPTWKFAVGRSGAAEMVVHYEGKEVHHLPLIEKLPPPTNSYWRMILDVEDK